MKTIFFKTAPLPFMGQKRRFVKEIETIIQQHPDDAIYVDLFGGSGLLSHTVKTYKPGARVIYNDFDNYRKRLEHISNTNALLAQIRKIVSGIPKGVKLAANVKFDVLSVVKQHESDFGYVDYITLSASLCFSMKYVMNYEELSKETLWQTVRASDYDSTGYLDGVEIESADYQELFSKYRHLNNVIWLVDPPYLSTETKTYSSYWKLRDYLDVLTVLDGTNYVYFTSNKSNIIELCEWIETRSFVGNPFNGAVTTTADVTLNHTSKYTDMMLYKYDFKPTNVNGTKSTNILT